MTQDDFLERLWTDVIDTVPMTDPGGLDFAHAARLARYSAMFNWCAAFDEAGKQPSTWLKWPLKDRRWASLVEWTAEGVRSTATTRKTDAPFADAERALERLLATSAPAELAKRLTRQGLAALAKLRRLLPNLKEAAGLHESLLTADPSGREARPGSWPPGAVTTKKGKSSPQAAGPLLKLRRAHELALSPDGRRVVAAAGGRVIDVATGKELAKCEVLPNTGHVAWSPDGAFIAATNTAGKIALFASKSGKRLRVLSCTTECAPPVFCDSALVGGDWDGHLFAWDSATGRTLAHTELEGTMISVLQNVPTGGGVLALISHKPSPEELVWLSPLLEERAKRRRFSGQAIDDFVVHPGGSRALTSTWRGLSWLDLKTGKLSKPHALDEVKGVALSPDGSLAIAVTGAGFRIGPASDLSAGRVHPMEYSSGKPSFSADGTRVALATWNGGEVWDVETLLQHLAAAATEPIAFGPSARYH